MARDARPQQLVAPRLSTSSTGGSTSRSGRSTHSAMIASYVPCRRTSRTPARSRAPRPARRSRPSPGPCAAAAAAQVGVRVPLVHGPERLEGEDADGILLGLRYGLPGLRDGGTARSRKRCSGCGVKGAHQRTPRRWALLPGAGQPRAARPRRSARRAPSPRPASASCPAAAPRAARRRTSRCPRTRCSSGGELSGARSVRSGTGTAWTSLSRSPRKVVQAPGAGVQPRTPGPRAAPGRPSRPGRPRR